MFKEKGIIIHSRDCNGYWSELIKGTGLNVLGVHPEGGMEAHLSLQAAVDMLKTREWAEFASSVEKQGIAIEFEMHALSWMLERGLFEKYPEWFRLDKDGSRTSQFNCCATNPLALEYISSRAAKLAKIFKPSTGKYYFWIDDVAEAKCECPACRELSASEQALMITNAIADGIASVDSNAKESYLAYFATLEVPRKVKPRKNVFLEFAPLARSFDYPIYDESCEKNFSQLHTLPELLKLFGNEDAKVLEYWMDNSLFSGWKRPPKRFTLAENVMRKDVKYYASLGFHNITSFGCFLGDDYAALYGDADIKTYGDILNR